MKCFQNKIRCRNARMMERSSLLMKKIEIGGAILISIEVLRIWWMCVSMKLKVLCLRVKSRIARIAQTVWRGEQFVGRRGLYSSFFYEENYGFYAIIM